MINFDNLDLSLRDYQARWRAAIPFKHLVIDNFANTDALNSFLTELPDPHSQVLNKSRDYLFAKNKYEKHEFKNLGRYSAELYADLLSERFHSFLVKITGRDIWIDREFHGGGIHQGGAGSYLDMHVDFNVHPLHNDWFRDLNILLYLNEGWDRKYGGELKLKHKINGSSALIEPIFNRCVIMETRDYTLHGYDSINFPIGQYRRSVACYAYSALRDDVKPHSTTWFPEGAGIAKRVIGAAWPTLVRIKSGIFGSGTSKNK